MLGERALAELGQRLLVFGAVAQLAFEFDPLGRRVLRAGRRRLAGRSDGFGLVVLRHVHCLNALTPADFHAIAGGRGQ